MEKKHGIHSCCCSAFDAGKAAAYGSLCRLMSQRPEETVPEGYFAAFYKCILKVTCADRFHLNMHANNLNLGIGIQRHDHHPSHYTQFGAIIWIFVAWCPHFDPFLHWCY